MAKAPKSPDRSAEDALRKAFKAIEAQPVPPALTDHVEQISAPKRRPDGRS